MNELLAKLRELVQAMEEDGDDYVYTYAQDLKALIEKVEGNG